MWTERITFAEERYSLPFNEAVMRNIQDIWINI